MGRANIRLSQCMIVKNEAKQMERALSWGRQIAYEQIVVDTGSTDQTVEIAQRMGAKVFHFPWIDDFSAAKNYAIEQASGNWIAFLDADEYVNDVNVPKILPLLQRIHSNPDIDLVRVKLIQLGDDGKARFTSVQDRFLRNRKGLRYRYRIHEQLHDEIKQILGCYDAQSELSVVHTGYAQGKVREEEKGKRNRSLLKQDLAEHPNDAMLLTYLGDAYLVDGQDEAAMDCYRKVLYENGLEMTDDVAYVRSALQVMTHLCNQAEPNGEPELYQISEGLKQHGWGMHPDLDYILGIWNIKTGNYEKAGILLESALGKMEKYQGRESVRISGKLEQICLWIAMIALEKRNNPAKAVEYAVTVLRMNKYNEEGLQVILQAFAAELGDGDNVDPYWNFLSKLYDNTNPRDLIFLYKGTQTSLFPKLGDRIWKVLPPELQAKITK